MRFADLAIQKKLILIVMVTNIVAMLFMCTAIFVHDVIVFRRATLRNLSTLADIVGSNTTAALAFDDRDAARETIEALAVQGHVLAAAVYSRHGELFARYVRPGAVEPLPAAPEPEGHRFGRGSLAVCRKIVLDREPIGTIYIRADLGELQARLLHYGLIIALVMLSSSFLALVLSTQLQRFISAPILELTGIARAISSRRDYSVRARKHGEDEIGVLIDGFNDMLEQIERRTQQLEAANRDLEAFSYSVSHDLRVPLRAIDGFSLILLHEHAAQLDAETQRLLTVIRKSTQQMGQLIDDLLAFSRLGRKVPEKAEIDMAALARSVTDELLGLEKQRQVDVVIGALEPAQGDRALVRQVLVNLVANSLKFTRRRERAAVEIGSRRDGDGTVYFVRDNGEGFDMNYADKLFQVFQRLHARDEFEGTGVGLAIVKRIVERHGGRVWGEGRVNAGATFSFTLPPGETGR
jgi:signal transduction histidine kinase